MVWPAGTDEPDITGDVSIVTRSAVPRRVLAFGTWLEPDKAQAMERAVDALRAEGKGFSLQPTTTCSIVMSRSKAARSAGARCCASRI